MFKGSFKTLKVLKQSSLRILQLPFFFLYPYHLFSTFLKELVSILNLPLTAFKSDPLELTYTLSGERPNQPKNLHIEYKM